MDVSRQETRGPKARTRRLMLATATRLMQAGAVPSVTEVAEAADVSRATAYRYFPSQAALVHAVVDEALGPILDWQSDSDDARIRTRSLLESSIPRIEAFEATFRAALKHALDQWAVSNAGGELQEPAFTRGHRIDLLRAAIAPLADRLPPVEADRLAKALSLLFGIEALVILKDIWGVDGKEAREVVVWAADILVSNVARTGMGGTDG
ncbi:TetR/AcrR family transcriptional regulator [Arvimicrobium flavum]|uniref:TetR/AcrR family transcriptional regulator n=1 Tax=Arvimicrobium flavum TaxID=3393320 RepID=UPI00237C1097|nr:TetR/AcrR family transcriptional regulator [Mesorhizobium shangrilense]